MQNEDASKFMELEIKFAQMQLHESNHLYNKCYDKMYRGWYIYEIQNEVEGIVFDNIVVRFRLPPAIPIYQGVVRKFSEEERLLGIHRMLVGKDLREDADKIIKFKTIEEYDKQLTEEEIKDLTERFKHIVTFDCNKIPYLLIIEKSILKMDYSEKINEFVKTLPDYIDIFIKVLNNQMTIQEASQLTKEVIYNEFVEL